MPSDRVHPPPGRELFLLPGALAFGSAPLQLRTLLGSCVSVVVWHERRQLGGMCHFLLPHRAGEADTDAPDGRFASESLRLLTQQIDIHQAPHEEYTAFICGGAFCFPSPPRGLALFDIGQSNLDAAERWCSSHNIQVQQRHAGGNSYRHIHFNVRTGVLSVRQGTPSEYQWADPS